MILDVNILNETENSKHFQKPDNNSDNNHYIENTFDFTIHRNIIIDKP